MLLRREVEEWVAVKLAKATDERLPAKSICSGTGLRCDLGITSLMAANIILDVEERFGIHVTDDDLTQLGTAGNLVDLIMAKVSLRPAGME